MLTNSAPHFDLNRFPEPSNVSYQNEMLTAVNDHVVRVSVMTEPFYWHKHPNSDETFLVLEGVLMIDLENESIELAVGQGYTVAADTLHRTWPKTPRSVNITVERQDIKTVPLADTPGSGTEG